MVVLIPALGRQRQEDAWGSLADQPSLLGKFQAGKKKIWWISKINMVDGTWAPVCISHSTSHQGHRESMSES